MMEEKYIKFDVPELDLNGIFYCESLKDDYEGFRFILKNDSDSLVLKVEFESHLAYRNSDEGDRLRFFSKIKADGKQHTIYSVLNSEWVDWLVKEAMGKYTLEEVSHYLVLTPNDVIEVLSLGPPTISKL